MPDDIPVTGQEQVLQEKLLFDTARIFNRYTASDIDYQLIVERMAALSGAVFVLFNSYIKEENSFQSLAVTGDPVVLREAQQVLGINLPGYSWPSDLVLPLAQRKDTITLFPSLGAFPNMPRELQMNLDLLAKRFTAGKAAIVSIMHENKLYGDFLLIFYSDEDIKNRDLVTTYADLVSLLLLRVQAEFEAARQKSEIEAFFSISPDLLCVVDQEGRLLRTNQTWKTILGYSEEDLYMRPFLDFVHPDDLAKTRQVHTYSQHNRQLDRFVNRYLAKDGGCHYLEWLSCPLGDNIFATARDISDRISREEELLLAKEMAEQANAAKLSFLANMSHEIRTPMNAILGFLQLLENSPCDREQMEFIHNIKTSSDILLTVINDILDVSKIESGRLDLEAIPFDLRTTVETAVIPFTARARQKNLELNMLIKSSIPPTLIGDPTRLRQVVSNLVSNAVKFTEKGDILVEVDLKSRDEEASEILFKVHDTGIGIPSEVRDRLFRPFVQVDESITRKYEGSGLGLSICKSLVKKMDGRIWVESNEGHGSTFSFTIRLKNAHNEEKTVAADYQIFKGKRILIVDDNSMNREIARIYLQEVGCMVIEAASGAEALQQLFRSDGKTSPFNVIIVDYQMPGMSGYDVAAALQAIPGTQQIPLVLLTSIAGNGESGRARGNGFASYLSKPYRRSELLDCLTLVLEGKKCDTRDDSKFITRHAVREARISGSASILVVDDSKLNNTLMSKMLQMFGLRCDIAENGTEAVQACLDKEYDLVFMDLQMPVMDGYEAVRRIRAAEREIRRPVIIAMTAHALEGEDKKCLEAGMDDYLSKPVDKEVLLKTLNKWIGSGSSSSIRDEAQTYAEIIACQLSEQSGFDLPTAQKLVGEYIKQAIDLLGQARRALRLQDCLRLQNILHQLKGCSGNIRAAEIARLADLAYRMARRQTWEEIAVQLGKIESLLDNLVKYPLHNSDQDNIELIDRQEDLADE